MENENPSNPFLEKKEIVELERTLAKERHAMKMEELTFERETMRKNHEWVLERGRIMRAEERKMLMARRSQ